MKGLPIISKDYPEFDWNGANGDATAAQSKAGYIALTTQGKTDTFSRFLWNDIVDKAGYLVKSAGLEWDSKYTKLDDCKIGDKYGALTAAKFNAVTSNLASLILHDWSWHYDLITPGYLGRTYVVGVSDIPEDSEERADIVYGHYILELVHALNLIIAIEKNEADFGEFVSNITSSTLQESPLRNPQAAAVFYEDSSKSVSESQLRNPHAGRLMASILSNTLQNSDLLDLAALLFSKTKKAKSGTFVNEDFDCKQSKPLSLEEKSHTITSATLGDLVYVAKLATETNSVTEALADFMAGEIFELVGKMASRSGSITTVDLLNSISFAVELCQMSRVKDDLKTPASFVIDKRNAKNVLSETKATVFNGTAFPIRQKVSSISFSDSKIVNKLPFPVYSAESAESTSESLLDKLPLISIVSESDNNSIYKDVFELSEPMLVESVSNEKTNAIVKITPLEPFGTSSSALSESETATNLYPAEKVMLNTNASSISGADVVLNEKIAFVLLASIISHSSTIALIKNRESFFTDSDSVSTSTVSSSLSFYSVSEWYDPVRTGNDLYIRSAYPQWQEGSNVHLDDSGVFYDPEQTGTDVYIKSKESMKEVVING